MDSEVMGKLDPEAARESVAAMVDSQPEPEPNSVVARLRELREQFQSDVTVDLEVPGYRGELVARYEALPWETVRSLAIRGERGKRNPENAPIIAADALANACVGMYFRENGGDLEPVTHQGDPVRYDRGLAAVLGLQGETVREIVREVFPDPTALIAHYGDLMTWQTERDDGLDEEVRAAAGSDETVGPTST